MARGHVVRGTPFTHIGPKAANEGYRQGGGNADNSVQEQYRGGGINTRENTRGTPAHYEHGNPGDAMREVAHGKYGMVIDDAAGNQNDPAANGSGVILDGADSYARGFEPPTKETMDSPVPRHAPTFDAGFIPTEDAAHLGRGNERSRDGLVAGGGVMSRGMVQKTTPSGAETQLTDDDTLPDIPPAR